MGLGSGRHENSFLSRSLYRNLLAIAVLTATSMGLVMVHGFRGFAPHDQSIVFDGAWRMMRHQVPYLDFVMPNGVVPMVIQYLFFTIAGVSWITYVAHAAVLNALYALVVWRGLRISGLDELSSLVYGLGAGVVFYSPIGTPYMDQHSFFFVGCLIVATVVIGTRQQAQLGWLIPILLVCGFLSKQIPAVFALPVVLVPFFTLSAGGQFDATWPRWWHRPSPRP